MSRVTRLVVLWLAAASSPTVDVQLVLRGDLVHGDSRFDEPAMADLIARFLSDVP